MAGLVEISGLWLNTTKEGHKYFKGYMGQAEIVILKNKYKEEDKHPDYILYVAKKRKPDELDDDAEEDFL